MSHRVPLIGNHELEVEARNDDRVTMRVHFDPKVMKAMGLGALTSTGLTLTRDEAELVGALLLEAAGWDTASSLHEDPAERRMLTRRRS